MLDASLPDEIISEILSPALTVADDAFSNNSGKRSPFSNYSESTSAYLLVCKSWLRVATPLLYNVVILRSKAQAKALARALSQNKDLGRFIKKLRVEGGYGAPMHDILKYSPNVSDLYLSLNIFSSDNTDGLCKGLHLINPTRLILQCEKTASNKMFVNLQNALAEVILKWSNLSIFNCPFEPVYVGNIIVRSLVQAKRLHTIVVESILRAYTVYNMFKEVPLQAIHIKSPVSQYDLDYFTSAYPILKGFLRYKIKVAAETTAQKFSAAEPSYIAYIAPSLNPFFVPMSAASKETQDVIWSRVLYFALSVEERAEDPTRKDVARRLPLLLVSKTFHSLGLPYYYSHVVFKSSRDTLNLASSYLDYSFDSDDTTASDNSNSADDSMRHTPLDDAMLLVFSKTSGLIRLMRYGNEVPFYFSISWDVFIAMAKSSGSSLRECYTRVGLSSTPSLPQAPDIFSHLVELRKLDWSCETKFLCNSMDAPVPVNALANLEELCIQSTDESFLTVLSSMKLTSLRHVALFCDVKAEKFLQVHGSYLRELEMPSSSVNNLSVSILDICPNLSSIALSCNPSLTCWGLLSKEVIPDQGAFLSRKPAASLVEIKLLRQEIRQDSLAEWEYFLVTFPHTSSPNLREIQVTCFEWPTSEREISKSCWVRAAERLVEWNIALADKTGKSEDPAATSHRSEDPAVTPTQPRPLPSPGPEMATCPAPASCTHDHPHDAPSPRGQLALALADVYVRRLTTRLRGTYYVRIEMFSGRCQWLARFEWDAWRSDYKDGHALLHVVAAGGQGQRRICQTAMGDSESPPFPQASLSVLGTCTSPYSPVRCTSDADAQLSRRHPSSPRLRPDITLPERIVHRDSTPASAFMIEPPQASVCGARQRPHHLYLYTCVRVFVRVERRDTCGFRWSVLEDEDDTAIMPSRLRAPWRMHFRSLMATAPSRETHIGTLHHEPHTRRTQNSPRTSSIRVQVAADVLSASLTSHLGRHGRIRPSFCQRVPGRATASR
ncbi:hypothetical protein GGX14DRAFT_635493 [Mycena pura]|uniref:Uncharacterized protein n=1 Tax=Mycena pura TaxID=153505 RepID=A0AAD6VAQ3_9AGAR|nr:hypothetical protein GGX14DRAFT_635493 [Mycena pura]